MTTRSKNIPKGWYSRGYLPHFDGQETTQSLNFRLFGSIPKERIEAWRAELALAQHLHEDTKKLRLLSKLEAQLDLGRGPCYLKQPRIGGMVEAALLFFDGERLRLHAWCVMPNHVHVCFTPMGGWRLAEIVKSWKSYTARQANRILGLRGAFWEPDYFDRYIRHADHYRRAVAYIENNPVKAGLCAKPEDWPFSSARLLGTPERDGHGRSGVRTTNT